MTQLSWGNSKTQYFYSLTPDLILNSIEKLGYITTGRCLALNSLENRVYQIECEDQNGQTFFIISKFYRPGRWSKEQILDEHRFLIELKNSGLPVIAPILQNNESLFLMEEENIYYTIFPRQGGRLKDELSCENLQQLGRLIARMHLIGKSKDSNHRIQLNPTTYGINSLNFLIQENHIPPYLEKTYEKLVKDICHESSSYFDKLIFQRIHGDCHIGNIIWNEDKASLVDFDDMVTGPPVQDLWPLVTDSIHTNSERKNALLEGYESMNDFDYSSWKIIESLRALRLIHFSAWLAKRYKDPAFQLAFPQFKSEHYWEIQIQDLREQAELIEKSFNPVVY